MLAGIGPQLLVASFVWELMGAWISLKLSSEVGGATERWLLGTVAAQARKPELPMPEVGICDSPEWNAFASGPCRNRGPVAVSSGMFPNELEAELAHEHSHGGNGDLLTMTLLQGGINAFVMFLARAVAFLLQRGCSDIQRQSPPLPAAVRRLREFRLGSPMYR